MNILLTRWIFELKEPIPLLKNHEIFLDNPRSEEEIEYVSSILGTTAKDEPLFIPEKEAKQLPYEATDFSKEYGRIAEEFGFQNTDFHSNFTLSLSKIWIVLRFKDHGILEAHKEFEESGSDGFILFDDDHPFEAEREKAVHLSYLVSLLVHSNSQEYFGRSFAHHARFELFEKSALTHSITQDIFIFVFLANPDNEDHKSWDFFPSVVDQIKSLGETLEHQPAEAIETLLYVANLLYLAKSGNEDTHNLVTLVSTLELLLTHNPDFNRFNVEDSISKQFRLKTSIISYLGDNLLDIYETRNLLKEIYSVRSMIAHGDFAGLKKFQKKKNQYYLEDLICQLYYMVRLTVELYLKDRIFLKFMKEN